MIKCPFCAEDIQDAAIKCKHCFSDLTKATKPELAAVNTDIGSKTRTTAGSRMMGEEESNLTYSELLAKAFPVRISKEDPKKEMQKWGTLNTTLICPHCQTKGKIRTMAVKRKQGISGAKATGALLTLGFSMLATGLSRKEERTQAHCANCNSTWDY